jgi:hypothetical protein
MSMSQGMPRITMARSSSRQEAINDPFTPLPVHLDKGWNFLKLRERHGTDPSLSSQEGTNPDDTLSSDFGPPELEQINYSANKFMLSLSHPVCGNLLWQPQETSTGTY